MVEKLIDLVLQLVELRYGSRSAFARELISLDKALAKCHEAYVSLSEIPGDQVGRRYNAMEEHKKAVAQLFRAMKGFEYLFDIYEETSSRKSLKTLLQSYAGAEAQLHPRETFQRILEFSVENSSGTDFQAAHERLRGFIRTNLKPEEIHQHG